jgi:hypothetical protein
MQNNTGNEWLWREELDALTAAPSTTNYYSKMKWSGFFF